MARYGLIIANFIILVAAVYFVVGHSDAELTVQQNALSSVGGMDNASALDQISSADIAVHIAKMTNVEELTAVVNDADTANAQLAITPADDKVIAKPQVVNTALKTKKDIEKYVVQSGDTLASVAAKFNVTSDSIRWSNNLTSATMPVGRELYIPPIANGIVYIVKAGDTADSLAAKYRANKERIVAFNDAEVTGGFQVGEVIVIPDGTVQQAARVATSVGASSAAVRYSGPVYGGNGYAYGYCTWWAANRRAQVGKPIPNNFGNAVTWKSLSQRAGLPGGNAPRQHAVIWFPMGGYGHVGFVESVGEDGSVNISDMNWSGWNRVTYRTIPASEAGRYYYIY